MILTQIAIVILVINFIVYIIKSTQFNFSEWINLPKTKKLFKIILIALIVDIVLSILVWVFFYLGTAGVKYLEIKHGI